MSLCIAPLLCCGVRGSDILMSQILNQSSCLCTLARQWMSSGCEDDLYWIWRNVRQLGQGKMQLMVTWASDAYAFSTFITLQLWITHVKIECWDINHHKFEMRIRESRDLLKLHLNTETAKLKIKHYSCSSGRCSAVYWHQHL